MFDSARLLRGVRETEERFRYLADSIPQLVWVANAAGENEYVNSCWLDYTGVGIESALGFAWENVIDPDEPARAVRRWAESFRSGTPYTIEYRIRRHDGV